MEALFLLESCINPKWLKYGKRSAQKMPSSSFLLRLATPAALGLHLFCLDKNIHYDKVGFSKYSVARWHYFLRQMLAPCMNQ